VQIRLPRVLASVRLQLATLLALVLGLLWTGTGWRLLDDWRDAFSREDLRTAAYAQAFAEHTLASFRSIDATLLALRHRWFENPDSFPAEALLLSRTLGDISVNVSVSRADGRMVYNSFGNIDGVNIADRDHFVFQRDAREDGLYVSKPMKGRVTGIWSLYFSRRLPNWNDQFTGVVVLGVDPKYFSRFYESLHLGQDGIIAMVRDSGEMLARSPDHDEYIGHRITGAPFLEPGAPSAGNYRRTAQTDGIDRIFGYRRLPEYGVTLLVGQSVREVLAAVYDEERRLLGTAAILSVLLILLTWFIDRGVVEREEAQARVRRLADSLEERVRERTGQLEAAVRQLEGFAYSVAHDLKSPLRAIDGYSALLSAEHAGQIDEAGRGYLARVRVCAAHMNQLIDDLLAYARTEMGDLEAAPVRLRRLVGRVLQERQDEIDHRGARVTMSLPEVAVHADPAQLTMVVRNLLDNALKFTHGADPPVIEIGGRREGERVALWVRDNGIGFDMQYHDRIFAIFQRLHRSEDYPGTGIGLAIVKKAMERMGGSVRAESRPGAGATFHLDLPAAAA
jgi:signal transduction histidine kinase